MKRSLGPAVLLILLVHVAADASLFPVQRLDYGPEWLFLPLLAIPLSQASLLGIWAATSHLRSYLRFALGLLAMASACFVAVRLVDLALQRVSLRFELMFVSQALFILVLLGLVRLTREIMRLRSRTVGPEQPVLQFSIASILIWTTELAVVLGVGKLVIQLQGWSAADLSEPRLPGYAVIAVFNASAALVALYAINRRTRPVLFFVIGAAAVALLGFVEKRILEMAFPESVEPTRFWLWLDGCQALYVYLTLLPLRLCGHWRQPTPRPAVAIYVEDQPAQTPATPNPLE